MSLESIFAFSYIQEHRDAPIKPVRTHMYKHKTPLYTHICISSDPNQLYKLRNEKLLNLLIATIEVEFQDMNGLVYIRGLWSPETAVYKMDGVVFHSYSTRLLTTTMAEIRPIQLPVIVAKYLCRNNQIMYL